MGSRWKSTEVVAAYSPITNLGVVHEPPHDAVVLPLELIQHAPGAQVPHGHHPVLVADRYLVGVARVGRHGRVRRCAHRVGQRLIGIKYGLDRD